MQKIATTIRSIRKNLNLTMVEFAELLGTEQSTISRYESGQFEPSRTVLILLYLVANCKDREAILEALGDVNEATLARFQSCAESLKLLERPDPNRREFADASSELLASKETIEPPLTKLVKLYPNKKVKQAVAHLLPYFEFLAK